MRKILTILAILMVAVAAKAADNVSTAEAFKAAIENNNDVNLTTDIDLSSLSAIGSGDAEGYLFTTYSGTLNGNGHSLKNSTHPLFYHASGATIKNITLDGFTVTDATSAIARTSANSTFDHITVKNSSLTDKDAGANVGMIAGYSDNDTFTYCTVAPGCSVSAKHTRAGGICGYYAQGDKGFSYCFNGASVSDGDHDEIGGIVGCSKCPQISHCLNTGYIDSHNKSGGICGTNLYDGLTIEYCVNTAKVEEDHIWYEGSGYRCGSIIGNVEKKTSLSHCIAFGSGYVGGDGDEFYGYSEISVKESYCYYYFSDSRSNLSEKGTSYTAMMTGEFAYSSDWLYQDIDNNTFGTHYPSPIPTAGEVYRNVLCDGTVTYSNKHQSRNKHTCTTSNGYCTTCGMRIVTISDADGLVSFANELNSGTKFAYAKATLSSDIDLTGRTDFSGIGSAEYTFKGTFDGQGHRIKNWTVNYENVGGGHGFFRRVSGENTTIKNLIIDSSCSITSTGSFYGTAGLIGFVTSIDGSTCNVTIENCGNEAAVTGYGTVSGVLGAVYNNENTNLAISNCYNTGTIKATEKDASALCASSKCNRTFTNCYNAGAISGVSDKHYFYDNSNGSGTVTNCYDVNYAQTGVSRISAIQVSSGELCNLLNTTETVFSQDVQTDSHPIPGTEGLTNAVVLHIANADDMAAFATNVNAGNTYGAAIVYLDDDIDLSTLSAISSGDGEGYLFLTFAGTFEGNGHTLKNSSHGLFRHTGNATIENLILDGFTVTDQTSLIACTSSSSTFSNIMVKNSSLKHTSDDTNNFGMIVGWSNYDNIRYCSVESDCSVTANRQRTGGLVGESFRGKISYCRNSATITGDADDIGGIVGKSGDSSDGAASTIEYCLNTGTINGDDQCGGIVGYYRQGTITNCVNTGTITSKDGDNHDNQGGIAGKISNANCNNSINFGPVVKCKSQNSQFAIYGGKDGDWSASGNEYYCDVKGKHFDTGMAYADIMSGKYAYTKDWLYQDIDNGTFTATAYPVPVPEAGTVYYNILCDNTQTYSNNYQSAETHESQLDDDGVCTLCGMVTKHITDGAGLESLSTAVNSAGGRKFYNVYLDNDIALTQIVDLALGATHNPIGISVTSPFKGKFDGQGHSITGMRLTFEGSNIGLFGVLSGPGTVIKNVVISSDCTISSLASDDNTYTYGIAGIAGAVTSTSGIPCNVTIENCGNEAYITQGDYNVAGILGRVLDDNSTITINNCYNTSAISGNYSAATICGYAGNNYTITNCYNGDYTDYPFYLTGTSVSSASSATNCFTVNSSESETVSLPAGVTRISAYQLRLGNLCQLLNANRAGNADWAAWTQDISKQDVNHKNFHPTFGTEGLHYARTMANQWGTICLPFAAGNGDDYDLYELSGVSGDALTLTKVNGTLAAGTPAIVRRNTSATGIDVQAVGNTFTDTPVAGSSANGLTLTGAFCSTADELFNPYIHTFESVEITNKEGYIISNNAFWHIADIKGDNKVYCSPFRAYLASTNSSGAKQLTIGGIDDAPTAIETIDSPLGNLDDAAIYDLNGRRIDNLQKGINIVKYNNGVTKKIIIK